MFDKVLVANRGAVAARVLRALYELGVKTAAVYSEADYGAPYLELASETYAIGPAPAQESYLNQGALVDAIKRSRAQGVHPGYGFLSENADFAQRVIDAGARFVAKGSREMFVVLSGTGEMQGEPYQRLSAVLPEDDSATISADGTTEILYLRLPDLACVERAASNNATSALVAAE